MATSSIGPTGDFSTVTLWEAATDNDLVAAGEGEVGELQAGTLVDAPAFFGATTNSTFFRQLRPVSGAEHKGVVGAGAILDVGFGNMNISEANMVFEDLQFQSSNSGTEIVLVQLLATFRRCIFFAATTSTKTYACHVTGASAVGIFRSCLIVAVNRGYGIFGGADVTVQNCVLFGRADDIGTQTPFGGIQINTPSTATVENVVAYGFENAFRGSGLGSMTQSNNVTDDATAAGTSPLTGQTPGDLKFRYVANALDHTPKSGSVLNGAGKDLSGTFNFDLANDPMPTVWPVGCLRPSEVSAYVGASSVADNNDGSATTTFPVASGFGAPIQFYDVHVNTVAMSVGDLDGGTFFVARVKRTGAGPFKYDVCTVADGETNLADGVEYFFAIRPVNDDGDTESNAVNVSVVVTDPSSVPFAPSVGTGACCPMGAVFLQIVQVDAVASEADGKYSKVWRETKPVSTGSGPGTTDLTEFPTVSLRCQMEYNDHEKLRMIAAGNAPMYDMVSLVWQADLVAAGLVDVDGVPTINENTRLVGILDTNGRPIKRMPRPAFLHQIKPDSQCCAGNTETWRLEWSDRRI